MTSGASASIHASAVRVGEYAILIRGPSGAGKSRLAFELMMAGRATQIPPSVLVGDDRVHLEVSGHQLVVRPAATLAGLIEVRGLGIRRCQIDHQPDICLGNEVAAADAERLPSAAARSVRISGVELPRIPVTVGFSPLPLVLAVLTTTESSSSVNLSDCCVKGIGNHIDRSIATE